MEQPNQNDPNSLEKTEAAAQSPATIDATTDNLEGHEATSAKTNTNKGGNKLKQFFKRFNIYFLLFILLIVIAVTIVIILAINAKNSTSAPIIDSQTLSDDALKQLANSDVGVGDPKQVLTVQSSAIFGGKVLIKQNLEVANNLTVGGDLNIGSINVSGKGTFDELQANNLTLTNNAIVQGTLSVQKSVTINGSGTFSGAVTAPTINTSSLQLNGEFTTTRHIIVGGSAPSKADGNALGNGGTSSVSGSDTAGSVAINTGTNPAAGCFANITFAQRFSTIPKVIITPIGSAAGGIEYYVNRSVTGFSICTSSPADAGQSFGFDYFIVG